MNPVDTNLGTVGYCIYCGSTDDLSMEHVIPLGLGGPAKLFAASCGHCRDLTSAFELLLLRGQFAALRVLLDLPTRHPKKRPTSFPARVRTGDVWEDVELSLEKHTTVVMFPRFPPPSLALHRAGETQVSWVRVMLVPRDEIGFDPARRAGVDAIEQTVQTHPLAFVQLLAKIAWGFTVSEYTVSNLGLDRLEPLVLDVIDGTDPDPFRWVGGMPRGETGFDVPPDPGWQVRVQEQGPRVLAWIRFLAKYDTPEYVVVVARVKRPPPTA